MNQHFHREVSDLYTDIARLGGLVEEAIAKAMTSLYHGDRNLAKEVRRGDNRIDELEVQIEERCLNILALYQPVARDLRFIVTALKVNNELEHMGDLAEAIARKTKLVPRSKVEASVMELAKMGEETQRMVSLSLDALLNEDSEKAREVIRMDDEIDRYHSKHHRMVARTIEKVEKGLTMPELKMLSVSRSLERIADLATSIAEDVIYYVDATIVRHRPASELDD